MARLIISSPDGAIGILELAKPVVTIGRGSANDLVLDDESVSRFHAVLKQVSGKTLVADRSSTNGVVVNGKPISAETALRHGDRVKVGIYQLKFESKEVGPVVIRKAEIPSTLRDVLEGRRTGRGSGRGTGELKTPTATSAEMAERIRQLEQDKYLLTVLYDAGKALNSTLSVDDLAGQVMSLAFRIEGVERGFMMFFDAAGEVSRQTEVYNRSGTRRSAFRPARKDRQRRRPAKEQPRIVLGRAILERIRQEKAPILIADAAADERFQASDSVKISGLRSAMCAPLVESGRLLGLLYVDNLEKEFAFSEDELNVFALVATQAASALDSALARQQLAGQALHRAALERFLSPDVVEMIAADPNVHLGGVNQKVSVLFCDIRGFTSISEQLAPEKVVQILNEFFTRVTDVVFDHGGTLDKYLGDGLLAVFGAPISKGTDAANAVRAAIAIQKLVLELNRDSTARQWPELKVGIGVSTGLVTAGNIGSPRRLDYTVVGDTVNVASRLVSHAAGGQILITQATAVDLGPGFDCAPMAPLLVKGKAQPVAVFIVRWIGAG